MQSCPSSHRSQTRCRRTWLGSTLAAAAQSAMQRSWRATGSCWRPCTPLLTRGASSMPNMPASSTSARVCSPSTAFRWPWVSSLFSLPASHIMSLGTQQQNYTVVRELGYSAAELHSCSPLSSLVMSSDAQQGQCTVDVLKLLCVSCTAAGVFPFRTHLSASRPKRGYVEVTMEDACPLFTSGPPARGHICHTAEILQVSSHLAGPSGPASSGSSPCS